MISNTTSDDTKPTKPCIHHLFCCAAHTIFVGHYELILGDPAWLQNSSNNGIFSDDGKKYTKTKYAGPGRGGVGISNLRTVAALEGKFAIKSLKRRTLFGRQSARNRICLHI